MAGDKDDGRAEARKRRLGERLEALVAIRGRPLTRDEQREFHAVFPAFMEALGARVLDQLRKRVRDLATAEDLALDTFEEFREEAIEHGFPDALGPWIDTIALRKLLNHLHKEGRSPFSLGLPSSGSEPKRTPREIEREMDLKAFREELGKELSDAHIEVVELCILSDMRIHEAAEALKIPPGTVASRLRSAKIVIKRLFTRWFPPSQRR